MKVLVLYHTAWMESMLKSWQRSGKVEVAAIPLPVVDWDKTPGLKEKIAKLIVDYTIVWRPDFILDVNGFGAMPVPGQERWTPELTCVPWVEWWYDDPINYAKRHKAAGTLELWQKAIGCPLVRNLIWDASLAKEYSEWTGKPWGWLSAATEPDLFSPEAAEKSSKKFAQTDIGFLGSYYKEPKDAHSSLDLEMTHAVSMRIMHPGNSCFENFSPESKNFPLLAGEFAKAKRQIWGAFSDEIIALKDSCNAKAGYFCRSNVLNSLNELFPSRFFAGDGFPDSFKPINEKLFIPSWLSACYRSSVLAVDLANWQSYTGTNMRVYDILAAGAILASNRRPDFDRDGSLDGKVYFHFEKAEELPPLVEKLKRNPELRKSIGENARNFVLGGHTWVHRLPAIMEAAKG